MYQKAIEIIFFHSKNWTSKTNLDGVHIGRVYACSRTTPFFAKDARPLNPSESLLFHGTSFTPSQKFIIMLWHTHRCLSSSLSNQYHLQEQGLCEAGKQLKWRKGKWLQSVREEETSDSLKTAHSGKSNTAALSSSSLHPFCKGNYYRPEVICAIIIRMRMWNHAWCSKMLICSERPSSCMKISLFSWFQKGVDLLRPPQWALLKAGQTEMRDSMMEDAAASLTRGY